MKAFVDTGGWVAYFDQDDNYHEAMYPFLEEALQKNQPRLATSDYIFTETVTYLRYHVNHAAAVLALTEIRDLAEHGLIDWLTVDKDIIQRASEIFIQYDDQKFSFTDCTSFALCEREHIMHAVAIDRHFRTMRMILLPPGLVPP